MNNRMLMLTIESVSWRALQNAARSGAAPGLARLMQSGVAAPLSTVVPPSSPAAWVSLATGVLPEDHGVVYPEEPWAGGLRPTGRASWLLPPVWQMLADEGWQTGSVCFPFARPGGSWVGLHIDDRLTQISGISWDDWPLPLDIAPGAVREQLRELRIHPTDLNPSLLQPFETVSDNWEGLSLALARCSTLFAAAETVLRRNDLHFVAVHLDWMKVFESALGYRPERPLPRAVWALLDSAIVGLHEACGPDAVTLIASPGAANLPGFFVGCGFPRIPWRELAGTTSLDLAPTVLAHFELAGKLPGKARIGGKCRATDHHEWPRASGPGARPADISRVVGFGHVPPSAAASWPAPRLLALAELLMERDLPGAKSLVNEALELAPDSLQALGLAGVIAYALGEAEALPDLADRIGARAPTHPWEILARAGYHVIRREASLAAPFLERIEASGDPDALLRAAGGWLILGCHSDAARLFERVLQVQPECVSAMLGLASTKADQPTELVELLRRVVDLDPCHAEARQALFRLLISKGRHAEAVSLAASF